MKSRDVRRCDDSCSKLSSLNRRAAFTVNDTTQKSIYDQYAPNEGFSNRISCVEKGYPELAHYAFTPLMGVNYFPPSVRVATDPNELKLSCGGDNLHVSVYDTLLSKDSPCTHCIAARELKPRDLEKLKEAGIKTCDELKANHRSFDNRKCDGSPSAHIKKVMPAKGGWSNTCCPPPNGLYKRRRELGHENLPDGLDYKRCYRGLFGETESCETQLKIGIFERKTCPEANQKARAPCTVPWQMGLPAVAE